MYYPRRGLSFLSQFAEMAKWIRIVGGKELLFFWLRINDHLRGLLQIPSQF